MHPVRLNFAPLLAATEDALAAIGASEPDDLFEPERLATFARAEELPSRAGDRVLRLPLPGTPDATGRVHERPRGAGTGHVVLRTYRRDLRAGLAARFTHPRSASLAEREWNLSCALREAGVATPDLLLTAARGTGLFSFGSVLVVRDLTNLEPFDRWLSIALDEEPRRLGLEAVSSALARLERSRVLLPELEPCDLFLTRTPAETCGASAVPVAGALRKLPGVVVANLRGGARLPSAGDARVRQAVGRLRGALESLLPAPLPDPARDVEPVR